MFAIYDKKSVSFELIICKMNKRKKSFLYLLKKGMGIEEQK